MNGKSFELLLDLTGFIGRNKVKQLSFPLSKGDKSLRGRLYDGLTRGTIKSPEDIARKLFPDAKDKAASVNRLQSRLWEALLDVVFLIDANKSGFNELQKAYYQCSRDLLATKILIGRFQRTAGALVAEKAIKVAIRFEISNIVFELASDLRFYYGVVMGNSKKWKNYDTVLCDWSDKRQLEILVEGYYIEIMVNFIYSKSTKKEFSRKVEIFLNSIETEMQYKWTVRVFFYYYYLKTLRFEIENDFQQLQTTSEEALRFFESRKKLSTGPIFYTFHKSLLIATTRLRKFPIAESAAVNCVKYTTPGTLNWYNSQYLTLILFLQSERFEEAWATWKKTAASAGFDKLPTANKESWQIAEAMVQFLMKSDKIQALSEEDRRKKFRITKFLNEVPAFSKDKRGNNINILVLHILFLVQGKRYNEIHDRVESLRVYASRYLRKDDMFRSNCFIRMLMCLPAGYFHKEAVLRKAKPFWEKLQTVPYVKADQPIEVEIVPYETLWGITLELLDRNNNA